MIVRNGVFRAGSGLANYLTHSWPWDLVVVQSSGWSGNQRASGCMRWKRGNFRECGEAQTQGVAVFVITMSSTFGSPTCWVRWLTNVLGCSCMNYSAFHI